MLVLAPSVHPWPIGPGPRYQPPARPATSPPASRSARSLRPAGAVVPGPPRALRRPQGGHRPGRDRRRRRRAASIPSRTPRPDGVVEVARGRALDARRPLPGLGPAARAAAASPRSRRRTPSAPTSAAGSSAAPSARSRSRRTPRSCSSSAPTSRPIRSSSSPEVTRESSLALPSPGAALLLALAGCGGGGYRGERARRSSPRPSTSSSTSSRPGPSSPGKPVKVSFTIQQPDGTPLTHFKTGAGPHTGVHLILVRDDLAYIIHQHPPVGGARRSRRRSPSRRRAPTGSSSTSIRRRADQQVNSNFQLFGKVDVKGDVHAEAAAADRDRPGVDGYRFTLHGAERPEGDPGAARHRRRHRARRQEADVHAVVRRARTRDLLPQGQPRLLPHPRLRAGRERLHERARRRRRSPAPRPRRGS